MIRATTVTTSRLLRAALAALTYLTISAATAQAQDHSAPPADKLILLSGDALLAEFSGQTRQGAYQGASSIFGKVTFTETTHEDGRAIYSEGGEQTTGRWSAAGDRICFKYKNDQGRVYCFRKYKIGSCVYSYGYGRTTIHGPINPAHWSSKSIIKGDVSTCDDLLG